MDNQNKIRKKSFLSFYFFWGEVLIQWVKHGAADPEVQYEPNIKTQCAKCRMALPSRCCINAQWKVEGGGLRLSLGTCFSGNKHWVCEPLQGQLEPGGQSKAENTGSKDGLRLRGVGCSSSGVQSVGGRTRTSLTYTQLPTH